MHRDGGETNGWKWRKVMTLVPSEGDLKDMEFWQDGFVHPEAPFAVCPLDSRRWVHVHLGTGHEAPAMFTDLEKAKGCALAMAFVCDWDAEIEEWGARPGARIRSQKAARACVASWDGTVRQGFFGVAVRVSVVMFPDIPVAGVA